MQRNSPGAARGGPVVLRPVRATPRYASVYKRGRQLSYRKTKLNQTLKNKHAWKLPRAPTERIGCLAADGRCGSLKWTYDSPEGGVDMPHATQNKWSE